ncbi:DUF1707 domain-containing protein [Glycomyces sp. TRM65418]|uniref:DUF1707 SHOCT-like domain-containing protein n=1 Tax=Glycomyces sp. TRM65418 TaxID=2867006 RepID=UPI001CE6E763|nr:DUF1707 domain-containing protein [Glycomyces sp. TRM65418]MCC3762432.1 DUF1707 domain-containing protein [Glycomyces sp. TRM65418]QZD56476.1 DUF1707 domain-containing protein [Glycomyces sp. TRM65418]
MTDDHGKLRISNADRDKAIQQLQAALDEGRIDLVEFDERAKGAYEAKTNAELDLIFEDLPGGRPKEGEVAVGDRAPADADAPRENAAPRSGHSWHGGDWMHGMPALRALIVVGGICTMIWLAGAISSGDFGGFWPIWPIMGLSIATFVQLVNRGR